MRVKHSKYRNTGLLFELLVKQTAADTISNKESKALTIIQKYFNKSTEMGKERKLYEYIINNNNVSEHKATQIIESVLSAVKKISRKKLRQEQYNLVKEIKEHYNIDDFFSIQVPQYKELAATYCLFEAELDNKNNTVDDVVKNRTTLYEYLIKDKNTQKTDSDKYLEEYMSYDKDLRLLTYKILLKKFNGKYKDLTSEQKNVLREFIVSVDSTNKLKDFVNTHLKKVHGELKYYHKRIDEGVTKIKLEEVIKNIRTIKKTEPVKETHLIKLLEYYELIKELRYV